MLEEVCARGDCADATLATQMQRVRSYRVGFIYSGGLGTRHLVIIRNIIVDKKSGVIFFGDVLNTSQLSSPN
jgi:hypothetical protein